MIPPIGLAAAVFATQRAATRRRPTNMAGNSSADALRLGAAALLAAPVIQFRASRTTIDPRPGAQPRVLVTDGVLRCTRNPMYLAMASVLAAEALRRPTLASILPVVAFVGWIDRVQIPQEEAALRLLFGGEFEEYERRVPRWFRVRSRPPVDEIRPANQLR